MFPAESSDESNVGIDGRPVEGMTVSQDRVLWGELLKSKPWSAWRSGLGAVLRDGLELTLLAFGRCKGERRAIFAARAMMPQTVVASMPRVSGHVVFGCEVVGVERLDLRLIRATCHGFCRSTYLAFTSLCLIHCIESLAYRADHHFFLFPTLQAAARRW